MVRVKLLSFLSPNLCPSLSSSPYLCMFFVIHFQMLSCTYHTQPLKPASKTASCFAWAYLWRVPCNQLQNFFYSHLWKFLFNCDGLKNRKTLVRSLTATMVPVSVTGCCVSLWFHTCLSAAVISALKLIIWSGEQLLQCAENLEQRGQMVTIELLFK